MTRRGDQELQDLTLVCTIVITCFNKGRFLDPAIRSALEQTYQPVEILVVDDGSTDHSAEIIEQYRGRIRAFRKPNEGQASAINLGFRMSTGQIVLFLDGDDVLFPQTVAKVVARWKPGLSKVHFRLQKMAETGSPLPGRFLPPYRSLPSGDLKWSLLEFGFYASPPMTGNAFSREYLSAVLPLDEARFRIAADTPIIGLAPLFGDIEALAGTGGCWREHRGNHSSGGLETINRDLRCCDEFVTLLRSHLSALPPEAIRPLWPFYLKRLLLVTKFDPRHQGSSLYANSKAYFTCIRTWPEYTITTRLKFLLWLAMIILVPSPMLRQMPGIAGPNLTVNRAG